MYKILTSIIAERTYNFLNEHQLLPSEQKGCKRGSYGYIDQLLINKMILDDCKTKKKNLSTAWIDYKKTFDSVPHTWIIKCMEIYKTCPVTVNFIAESMKCWKTTIYLNHAEGSMAWHQGLSISKVESFKETLSLHSCSVLPLLH